MWLCLPLSLNTWFMVWSCVGMFVEKLRLILSPRMFLSALSARFEGDDFMFELTREEVESLSRCKNYISNQA